MSDQAAGDIFTGDAPPEAGWIAAEVREEFPALALHYTLVNRGSGRSTREVKERLRDALATMRLKDAATAVAGALGLPRQQVYRLALGMKDE